MNESILDKITGKYEKDKIKYEKDLENLENSKNRIASRNLDNKLIIKPISSTCPRDSLLLLFSSTEEIKKIKFSSDFLTILALIYSEEVFYLVNDDYITHGDTFKIKDKSNSYAYKKEMTKKDYFLDMFNQLKIKNDTGKMFERINDSSESCVSFANKIVLQVFESHFLIYFEFKNWELYLKYDRSWLRG